MIHYHVSFPEPHRHVARILLAATMPDGPLRLHLPVWTPGSYLVREFSRYLQEFEAHDESGKPLATRRLAKGSWEVTGVPGTAVRISYAAYCHERSVRTPHIDGGHAFFTGSNLLLRVEGAESGPHTVQVTPPPGWTVFTAGGPGVETRVLPDYDHVADLAVEVGPHRHATIGILGVDHDLVFWGADQTSVELPRLSDAISRIVEANARMFGGSLPYTRYMFVFHIASDLRGGLEHLDSTVLATPWRFFETDAGWLELLGLISHEHFHVWNVKRIRPSVLGPFDYQSENYTRSLWISEGATSYFDNLNCLRAGVMTRQQWLDALATDLTRYLDTPGRHAQSVAESSFDAWIRLYRPDENTSNRTVSYYLKGAIISLCLDLTIRARTAGGSSFDALLQQYWRQFLADGRGFDEDRVAEDIRTATGVDVGSELQHWVESPNDPPIAELLASHGIRLVSKPTADSALGFAFSSAPDGWRVSSVAAGGPAAGRALYPGDTIVAIDGRRATADGTRDWLLSRPAGTGYEAHLFRRDRLIAVCLQLGETIARTISLEVVPAAAPAVKSLLDAWLPSQGENPPA